MPKKTTLTVAEIRELHNELTGSETFKGLLKEKLSLVMKFHLTNVAKQAAEVYNNSEPLRVELITSHGEDDGSGGKSIPNTVNSSTGERVINPKLIEFHKEWSEVISVTKEIEHHEFSVNDLASIETDANYPVFFSLVGAE